MDVERHLKEQLIELGEETIGARWLTFCGAYDHQSEVGVYGSHEYSDKVAQLP